jgi:hypothetical protein
MDAQVHTKRNSKALKNDIKLSKGFVELRAIKTQKKKTLRIKSL